MDFTPLSARSIALSTLIGTPTGRLPARDLVAAGVMCEISPPTMRVALSRLVAAGELEVTDSVYSLSVPHRERQRAQERDLDPAVRPWSGYWEMVVVVETGRDAPDRARLRTALADARLAELREGVWMRPANLERPMFNDPHVTTFRTQPHEPDRVCAALWDLDAWAQRGHALLTVATNRRVDARRFAAVAALVRHLRTDPVLPHELTPPNWPADAMRQAYADYRAQLHAYFQGRDEVLT